MGIANPRIHIICGLCGDNKSFEYSVESDIEDDTGVKYNYVSISCRNCGSLTHLDEIMKERKENNGTENIT